MVDLIREPIKRFSMPPMPLPDKSDLMDQERHAILPELDEAFALYRTDPLSFVRNSFYWGNRHSFLARYDGPLAWQCEVLEDIGLSLQEDKHIHRFAIASGKGVGKTVLAAQLFLWHVACHRGQSQTVATSVTGFQSASRFWREIRRWRNEWKYQPYFKIQSTRLEHISQETWGGLHQTWSVDRPEAFQGIHEQSVLFVVDEASGIDDVILETIEGGTSDNEVILLYISNPTRKKGRFFLAFQHPEWWSTWHIDGRNVPTVTAEFIAKELTEANGDEDSTSFRRNIRGEFPLVDHDCVIPDWILDRAIQRHGEVARDEPIHIGADIARKGENRTVFTVRRGCKILLKRRYAKLETDISADYLMELIDELQTQHPYVRIYTYIDCDGVGGGVADNCKRRGYEVVEVHSQERAMRHERYGNRRAEMWFAAREWCKSEGCLDGEDTLLIEQLGEIYYHHDNLNRVYIESKDDLLARGLMSPDDADSFVYTFYNYTDKKRAHVWGRSHDRRILLGPNGQPVNSFHELTKAGVWGKVHG